MKLTKEILWNNNFINKFTNLRTSFLIFLTRILIDTKEKYNKIKVFSKKFLFIET